MDDWQNKKEFEIIVGEQTPKIDCSLSPVPVWIKENIVFLKDFLNYSFSLSTALGVAANQVSHHGKRVMSRFFSYRVGRGNEDPFKIIIDPVIIKKYGDPVTEIEGCLCWPGFMIKAQRWMKLDVSYYNIDGEFIKETLERETAQVWQHEMDHLDGVKEDIVSGPLRIENKIGRNDPCPCGRKDSSGKPIKYKRCCGK